MNKYFFFLTINFFIVFAQKKNSKEQNYLPDVSISKIKLLDTLGVEKYIGSQVIYKLNNGLPRSISFSSSNFNQTLEIYHHPGANKNEFSEFRVYYSYEKNDSILDDIEFITESGICLGITKKSIQEIKGPPKNIILDDKIEIYEYSVNDFSSSLFLKKYNMPEYQSKYFFKDDILIRFHFGFIYP